MIRRITRGDYDALPDRQARHMDPEPNSLWRDSAFPGLLFQAVYSSRFDDPSHFEWMMFETKFYDPATGLIQENQAVARHNLGEMLPEIAQAQFNALSGAAQETMRCLFLHGPTWDGNVPSKSGRDLLIGRELAVRMNGWAVLTPLGFEVALLNDMGREKDSWEHRRTNAVWGERERLQRLVDSAIQHIEQDNSIFAVSLLRRVQNGSVAPEDVAGT